MAQVKISSLTTGTPKGTDLTPATDTTDLTEAATGTTKKYVRSTELSYYLTAQGVMSYAAVRMATTTALTATYANGALGVGATLTNAGAQIAFAADGVTAALNDRVLVKNQAAPAQNGIYTVTTLGTGATNWVLTRATDYDQAAEIIQFGVILVNAGSTYAGLLFQETGAGPWTMGATAITFVAYTSAAFPTPAASAVLVTTAASVPVFSGTMTNGQVIIGSTGATPVAANITGSGSITVTNGAGTININSGGGGYNWVEVTGTSQLMVDDFGYIANNVGLVTLTLPATAVVGDTISIAGKGAGLFTIAQNALQIIHLGAASTTIGIGGSITALNRYNSMELLCIEANTTWSVINGVQGSYTIV